MAIPVGCPVVSLFILAVQSMTDILVTVAILLEIPL